MPDSAPLFGLDDFMTNEQIDRAVAEELGWGPRMHPHDGLWSMGDSRDNVVGKNAHGGIDKDHCWRVCNLDFCNDYNAAAEIRKRIRPEEERRYAQWLLGAVLGPGSFGLIENYWRVINATPRQQAEAFLRMRGKWRDGE